MDGEDAAWPYQIFRQPPEPGVGFLLARIFSDAEKFVSARE